MIAMSVVRLGLKTDILKLKGKFLNGYQNEDHLFYLYVTNETSLSQDVTHDILSSSFAHWIKANDIIEDMFEYDHAIHCF